MERGIEALLGRVREYYSSKLERFGPTSRGVDWSSPQAQALRFEQLETLFARDPGCSLLDYGCGLGALYAHLQGRARVAYAGFDIAPPMIEAASRLHPGARWLSSAEELGPADYVVASGTFNVKLDCDEPRWAAYLRDSLRTLHWLSREGFAFNLLTCHTDAGKPRKDHLFYGDPCEWFEFCRREFSPRVALLHDYGLYEFTIVVRRVA